MRAIRTNASVDGLNHESMLDKNSEQLIMEAPKWGQKG